MAQYSTGSLKTGDIFDAIINWEPLEDASNENMHIIKCINEHNLHPIFSSIIYFSIKMFITAEELPI